MYQNYLLALNVIPTLTLILILILTLPRTKNPVITLALTICWPRYDGSWVQLSAEQMSDHLDRTSFLFET